MRVQLHRPNNVCVTRKAREQIATLFYVGSTPIAYSKIDTFYDGLLGLQQYQSAVEALATLVRWGAIFTEQSEREGP